MMSEIFDGIGTEIIGIILTFLIGAFGGGVIGYKIGIKRSAKQKQIAGESSKQRQELHIDEKTKIENESLNYKSGIKQIQRAGNNANQTQIGGIKDDRR